MPYRIMTLLLLTALLISTGPAQAQPAPNPWVGDPLVGQYINSSNGGFASVSPRGSGYQFINENGDPARFVWSGQNQLRMVAGRWDPNIVATVSQDAYGRTVLRFDAPYTPTGYWVKAR